MQGGPLEHVIAAKAVALHEAQSPAFRRYAARIVQNARALAEGLMQRGWNLVSDGTDTTTATFVVVVSGLVITVLGAFFRGPAYAWTFPWEGFYFAL